MGNQQSPANDAAQYLQHYPNDTINDLGADLNYRFYTNQIRSDPDGDFIDKIHKQWLGNHRLLEQHHGYIQWLFPIREDSPFNGRAQRLMRHEIDKMIKDDAVRRRLISSYRLMLEFYGMQLEDEGKGSIGRGPNWRERYEFLNTSMHNFLRITRILKCLGELGLDHYQAPFVEYVFKEIIHHGNLKGLFKSARDYFSAVVRDSEARNRLQAMAESYMTGGKPDLSAQQRFERERHDPAPSGALEGPSNMVIASTQTVQALPAGPLPEASSMDDDAEASKEDTEGCKEYTEASKEDTDREI